MNRTTSPDFSTSSRSALSVASCVNTETGLFDTTSPLPVSTTASSRCISNPADDLMTTSRSSRSVLLLRLYRPACADNRIVLLSAVDGPVSAPVSDLGVNLVQLDDIRFGDILCGRFRAHLVPALVARVAAELRRFHRDLTSGDHELTGIDRQPDQDLQRIDPSHQRRGAEDQCDHDRDRHTQPPHPPAVTRGALERTALVAPFADGEAVTSRCLDHGGGGQAFFLAVRDPEPAGIGPNRPNQSNRLCGDVHNTLQRVKNPP